MVMGVMGYVLWPRLKSLEAIDDEIMDNFVMARVTERNAYETQLDPEEEFTRSLEEGTISDYCQTKDCQTVSCLDVSDTGRVVSKFIETDFKVLSRFKIKMLWDFYYQMIEIFL